MTFDRHKKFGNHESDLVGIDKLSDQQRRVAELVYRGFTNIQIAVELTIALDTVNHYVSDLYVITGVGDNHGYHSKRVALARWYKQSTEQT